MPKASLGAVEIEYETQGSAGSPAIVLIRGLGTQLVEWPVSLIDGLVAGRLRVIVFDNRDAGLSSRVESRYELSDMVSDLVGLMDTCGIDRAHVLGMSMGGIIAQHAAASFPSRVRTLISMMSTSGAPDLPHPSAEVIELMMSQPSSPEEALALALEKRARFIGSGHAEPDDIARSRVEALMERSHDPEGVARQMRAVTAAAGDLSRFEKISCPTLVLHGDEDQLVPIEHGRDTARRIQGAEFEVIQGMGHATPEGVGAQISAAVLGFIGRNS
ncbi:MAG: alpha/beta hydrolase [Gammaproteobacteria bacterium]|nr:alpha/beta hydrolase [Gammaproteobacteria bacterium]